MPRRRNPYASRAQQRLFHAMAARGEIPMSTVREFDRASKGKRLPQYVRRNPADPIDALIQHAHRDSFIRNTLTPKLKEQLRRDIVRGTYDHSDALRLWKQWARSAAETYPGHVSKETIHEVAREMRTGFEYSLR